MSVRHVLLTAVAACLLISGVGHAEGTSRSTFVKLMQVQELWAEDKYDEALRILQDLAADNRDKPYDYAVTQQYLAHTALLGDRMELVRPALEAALLLPGLPAELTAELKLFYGQVVLGDEEYELARSLLEEWYALMQATDKKPQPPQVFSLAYANYMTGNLPRAEGLLEDALGRAKKINNTWYRVYYQVLFEQKKYDKAETVIYGLASRDPNNETYWRMLGNHYMQMEDGRQALSAMAIAELQGLLDDAEDQVRLASLYGYVEIPEKAARILEAAVNDERVEADAKTLRRLGDLWLLARDRGRALAYLSRAAAVARDGKTYELVGSLFFEDEQWAEAYNAYLQALEYGGIDEPERVYLLAGMSAFRAGMTDAARQSFEAARKSDKHRSQALAMLRELNKS